jgi:ribosomal protein L10
MEASDNDYVSYHQYWLVIALYSFQVANGPGKILKISVKKLNLKGAYIAEIYIGDDQLDALATIKSREELIGNHWITSITSTKLFAALQIKGKERRRNLTSAQ